MDADQGAAQHAGRLAELRVQRGVGRRVGRVPVSGREQRVQVAVRHERVHLGPVAIRQAGRRHEGVPPRRS